MATLEQAAECAGLSVADFKALPASTRNTLVNRAERGTPMVDHTKRDRILAASELAEIETQTRTLLALPAPRFANGIQNRDRVLQHLADRAAGVRRRMDAQS